MLRNVSTCPYCGQVAAAVDDEGPDLVLAPDLAGGAPCGHLAFVVAALEAYDPRDGARVPERTGHWLWVRGAGTRSLPHGPVDPLSACVDEVACGFPLGGPAPGVPYAVGGATAGVRDAGRLPRIRQLRNLDPAPGPDRGLEFRRPAAGPSARSRCTS